MDTIRIAKAVLAGTSSLIGVMLAGGRIKYITCNYDSYNNLATLRQYYKDLTDIRELIDGGDIRGLDENIGDIERYKASPPKTVSDYRAFMQKSQSYNFLYMNGKWYEVSDGLPGRETKPDMRYVHVVEAAEALRKGLNVGLARTVFEKTYTMQERGSNKYHYFAIYDLDGTFVGGNAYGGIGQNPRTVMIAKGDRNTVERAVGIKIRSKKQKGYVEQN